MPPPPVPAPDDTRPTGFCHLDPCWPPCSWLKQYFFAYMNRLIRMEIAMLPTWRQFCLLLSKLSIYQSIHTSCFHLSSWIIKAFLFTISSSHAYVLVACVPCVFLVIEFQIFSLFYCIRLFWVGKYGYSTCKDNCFQVSEVIFSVLTF